MEHRGILCSVPGRGRFVNGDVAELRAKQEEKQLEALAEEMKKAVSMGVSRKRIIALAEEIAGGKADD